MKIFTVEEHTFENLTLSSMIALEDMSTHIEKILRLVSGNREFFGNPPAGAEAMECAANTLEELVAEYNEKREIRRY